MGIFSRSEMAPYGAPMMIAGVVSAIYGALMALAERDIKRIVAYSSVSQMGYILFALGTLTSDGVAGAIAHVVFHGIVKALLFMCVGLLMRATGRRTITELGGLGRAMPVAAACAAAGALALAGVPPMSMFVSEWLIFSGGFHTGRLWLAVAMVFSTLLTVGYSLWFFGRIFLGSAADGPRTAVPAVERLPISMVAPTVVLAVLALVAGLFPAPVVGMAGQALNFVLGGRW
jgi:NADH-quinone oxidoreductase subunit M